MFTGLVETIGVVRSIVPSGDVLVVEIEAPAVAHALRLGESICVSGACLSVTEREPRVFRAEMMPETASRTKLGRLVPGDRVNLERSLQLGGRLDGHLVSGHVDGVGKISRITSSGRARELFVDVDVALAGGIVLKGSATLDGVSLTVISAERERFSVGLIPTTLASTTLGDARIGDDVNVETDLLGKYVDRFLAARFGEKEATSRDEGVTWEKLREYGWA